MVLDPNQHSTSGPMLELLLVVLILIVVYNDWTEDDARKHKNCLELQDCKIHLIRAGDSC